MAPCSEDGPVLTGVCKSEPCWVTLRLLRIYSLSQQRSFQEGFELGRSITRGLDTHVINQAYLFQQPNPSLHSDIFSYCVVTDISITPLFQTSVSHPRQSKGNCQIAQVKWTHFHQFAFIMKTPLLCTKANYK